jgi:hypothetical protein
MKNYDSKDNVKLILKTDAYGAISEAKLGNGQSISAEWKSSPTLTDLNYYLAT